MPIEPLPWWRIAAPVLAFALLALARFASPQPRTVIIWRACLAVVGYAMAQDQVSARLSPAYFTIGHDPIPNLYDPTLLGLARKAVSHPLRPAQSGVSPSAGDPGDETPPVSQLTPCASWSTHTPRPP